MPNVYETDPKSNPSGSALGKYFTRIRLGKYERPDPFQYSNWDSKLFVYLPLPDQLLDNTSVKYSDTNLEAVGDLINQAENMPATTLFRQAGSLASSVIGGAGNLAGTTLLRSSKVGDFVEKQLGNIFPAEKINSALQQTMGATPNPNPSVMFQGPSLRSFSLSWSFYPKSKEESQNISILISKLKARALPTFNTGNNTTILNYPYMCQVYFFPWDNDSSDNNYGWTDNSIIKIKRCFMDSVNVRYNPFGTPAFFEGTNLPISYQLTISFKEIEYMTGKDWDANYAAEANTLYNSYSINNALTQAATVGAAIAAFPLTATNLVAGYAIKELMDGTPPTQEEQTKITNGTNDFISMKAGEPPIPYLNASTNTLYTTKVIEVNGQPTYEVTTYSNVVRSPDGLYRWSDAANNPVRSVFTDQRSAIQYIDQQRIYQTTVKLER